MFIRLSCGKGTESQVRRPASQHHSIGVDKTDFVGQCMQLHTELSRAASTASVESLQGGANESRDVSVPGSSAAVSPGPRPLQRAWPAVQCKKMMRTHTHTQVMTNLENSQTHPHEYIQA